MKAGRIAGLILCAAVVSATLAHAQPLRKDAIWARSTNGAKITLDGVLDEPAWAVAESVVVHFGVNSGDPGSGWKVEGGLPLKDSTYAVLKFLTEGDSLYVAITARDSSVGGSIDFNRFDGFLMDLKDHANASRPAPVTEYFYSWWAPAETCCASNPGRLPVFNTGRWSSYPDPRTDDQIAAFNGATRVRGLSNSDAAVDTGYVTELKFGLPQMGYHITDPGGDIVEWNIAIYDCDWIWLSPPNPFRIGYNRVWLQDPWGNVAWYSEVRIHCRPNVSTASGPVPFIEPELRVPSGANFATPVIDGRLDDAIWKYAPHFDVKYGDDALRASYPGVGPYRSGQFQPDVNGGQAFIADPGNGRFYYFFREDTLYLGFDVTDKYVSNFPSEDRQDGWLVTLFDRTARNITDHNLLPRRLGFKVGTAGSVVPYGYLPFLRDTAQGAKLGLQLKPGTTVDTTAAGPADQGYTAELALDLTKLGYASGLGDHVVWFGADFYDGDSFTDGSLSYATRTWWYEEKDGACCPVAGYLDAGNLVVGVDEDVPRFGRFALLSTYPNPSPQGSTIRYAMPEASLVTLELYDARGRLVYKKSLGEQPPGVQQAVLERRGTPGLHFYRLLFVNPSTGSTTATLSGKMILLQ